MAKVRVPIHQNPRNFTTVDPEATKGAQLGTNLYDENGQLLTRASLTNGGSGGGTNSISSTIWKLIREIPANIRSIASLVGTGFSARRSSGEWALRTLQEGVGIDIANPDGDAGDPVIGLEDVPDSGIGTLLATTFDAKGRKTGSRASTTTDLAEGTNLYFTAARADARITAQKGQPNGLAPLGPDSLIPTAYLPPLALTNVSVVNSQAEQLALVAQEGDVAVRTDISKNYIHNGGTAGTMADWTELLTPAAPVQSVNGQTGTVTLTADDVGAATAAQGLKADSAVQSVVAGTGVSVDSTDPQNPIVSSTGSGIVPIHNDLSGLQGGTSGERYHATSAQNASLVALSASSHIEGLGMVHNSGTSISFTSGTAAIQSTGLILTFPATITKSSLSLAPSTWYHCHGYSNAGTPDVEISTTAPASAYFGSARSKTGDTSKRYLGSFRTTAAGLIAQFQHNPTTGRVSYLGAPYVLTNVLSAGTATVHTTISCAGMAPVTATDVDLLITNIATSGAVETTYSLASDPSSAFGYANPSNGVWIAGHPVDASQAFLYRFASAPSGSVYIDAKSYSFAR